MDAVTLEFRVLGKPAFLWAPIVISAIAAIPLLFLPGYPESRLRLRRKTI